MKTEFYERFEPILNRIEKGQQTDEDIAILRQWLLASDRQVISQLSKYNVNIAEGKDIHIGDRIYQQWDKEAMEALVKTIQETSGIHQNTQGGDAAGRDIDKRNVYKNCTFIQFLTQDSNFDSFYQELFQDLDFSIIPPESIQKAYQDSLPPDADVWDLPPPDADVSDLGADNIAAILKKLEGFRQLSQFFERLSQDENVPKKIRDRIANKLASKKYPENGKNKSSTDFFYNQPGLLKSYLIATLVPGDNDGDKFLLNAWLIIDDSVQDLSKFQSLLDHNEQQRGKLCKLTQIPTELNKFLTKALRSLRGKRYDLTIEIFLPSDLMCMEIDRWKITDPIADDITLGIKYPIRLRSLERLSLDYLDSYLSQWCEYWDKVRDILQDKHIQEFFEHLQEMESFNWKLLKSNLNGKIGLKVTCTHSKSIRKDLFRAILRATTPIAIWIRTDIANLDRVTAIDKILTFKPLCHLCESVRLTREEADAQAEEHLGHHLALLWENPYRLTPDIMVELNSPGQ
jgi:vWA-MoxR associated protein C-terminal domain/Effector-associated domain 10